MATSGCYKMIGSIAAVLTHRTRRHGDARPANIHRPPPACPEPLHPRCPCDMDPLAMNDGARRRNVQGKIAPDCPNEFMNRSHHRCRRAICHGASRAHLAAGRLPSSEQGRRARPKTPPLAARHGIGFGSPCRTASMKAPGRVLQGRRGWAWSTGDKPRWHRPAPPNQSRGCETTSLQISTRISTRSTGSPPDPSRCGAATCGRILP